MKRIIGLSLLMLVLAMSSCKFEEEPEVPTNDLIGDYTYSTESTYFDKYGEENNRLQGLGSLSFTNKFTIAPRIGWSYTLAYTNLDEHVLSTGEHIFTFYISSQNITLNDSEFFVVGSRGYEVKDPDGSVIGVYDGWIDANEIVYFSYESVNSSLFTKTSTSFRAVKR